MKYREALLAAGRQCIEQALAESQGNVAKAARSLGVNRVSLYGIMERHGLHTTAHKEEQKVEPSQPLGFNGLKWLK